MNLVGKKRPFRNLAGKEAAPRVAERDGVALLLALLFVTLLTVIVVEYCYETQVDAALTENEGADLEAYVAAKSAVAGGLGLLAGDQLEQDAVAGAQFDGFGDLWAESMPPQPFNDGVMRCSISDEYGKLNLNAIFQYDAEANATENALLVEALRLLLQMRVEAFGLDENPADAILDWLDPDSEPREYGAEADFYTALEIPYPCKNGPMDSIDELLMIRGVTPDLFFGVVEEKSLQPEEQPPLPLTEYLTVHGDPRGRINVNTATPETLDAVFQPWGQPQKVELILERQAEAPFQTMADLEAIFDKPKRGDIRPKDVVTVSSRVFRLYGDGRSQEAQVRIEAYVWRNPGQATGTEAVNTPEGFRILDWRVTR